MIPRIWRYLFLEQLKMTTLAWIGSMMLFILLRIEEVARFASLGAPLKEVLLFVAILFPQLAILAFPLALLTGTYITWNRFSQSCELLGALTSGIRTTQLVFPTLCLSILIGSISGFIAIDATARAQLKTKQLKYHWSQVNPTHLLRSERIWQLPGATLLSHQKKENLEIFVISQNSKQKTTQLIHVEDLKIDSGSSFDAENSTHLLLYPTDHSQYLSLENTEKGTYSYVLSDPAKEPIQIAVDQLPLKALLSKLKEIPKLSNLEKRKLRLELPRRLFFFFLPISFALLALVASFHPDRRAAAPKLKPIGIWILLLLIAYFSTKGLSLPLSMGIALYEGLPLASAVWAWKRLQQLERSR